MEKACRFHASKTFFTDDEGVYLLDNRDSPARWTGHKLLRRGADAAGDGTRHFADMHDAVEALCERKFGPGGPFHPNTPGSWKDSGKVRSAAPVHNQEFRECVALPAEYIFDQFGKCPGTVPAMIATIYLQAHHSIWTFTMSSTNLAPTCQPTPTTWRGGMQQRLIMRTVEQASMPNNAQKRQTRRLRTRCTQRRRCFLTTLA